MRKIIVIAAVAVVAAMSLPARAVVNTVVAGPGATITGYTTTMVHISKSAPANFVSADIAPHDVTSNDKIINTTTPKFKSAVVSSVGTSPIVGLATLPLGNYGFHCSIHPGMKGTITLIA